MQYYFDNDGTMVDLEELSNSLDSMLATCRSDELRTLQVARNIVETLAGVGELDMEDGDNAVIYRRTF